MRRNHRRAYYIPTMMSSHRKRSSTVQQQPVTTDSPNRNGEIVVNSMAYILQIVACFAFILSFTGTKEARADVTEEEPDFNGPIKNVTVALGREAVLTCSVTELGSYKVGWLKAEDQTILSMHTRVVTHNARISVTHENQRTWRLHIRQLKESDRGCYMCQINTNVMKKQLGCVDVQVPPDIDDETTSSDVSVHEGGNTSLVCQARGRPPPRIVWRREDNKGIVVRNPAKEQKVEQFKGRMLPLVRVDRTQMGAYLCIATNDVPPAVSKRIALNVNFAPAVKVPNHVLGSPSGKNVTIICLVEAYPNTINYWLLNRTQMLLNGAKHVVEELRHSYRVTLRLTVKRFTERDSGIYTCVATNSLGKSEGSVRLYEIKIPTTTTTSTTTTTEKPTTTTELPTTPVTFPFLLPTYPVDPVPPEEMNEVDTSSIKSGRNSRRRQQSLLSNSANSADSLHCGTLPNFNNLSILFVAYIIVR